MAHIPKRTPQHGLFVPLEEVMPPELKPGQKELHRRDMYSSQLPPREETYITKDGFRETTYGKTISNVTEPEDYVYTTQPMPMAAPPPRHRDDTGTRHWRSEYNAAMGREALDDAEYFRQVGDPNVSRQPPAKHHPVADVSLNQEDFGEYGTDPRDKIGAFDDKLPVIHTDRSAGTTKGTVHLPGYQGHLPVNPRNSWRLRAETGMTPRSLAKVNPTQTCRLNVVGYTGHVPDTARNDRGPRKPTTRTTYGEDFPDFRKLMVSTT
mmetsp:Transcript_32155/g.75509  ORF Transcript_32155/g.75509 Transcript_32155/m.75509 type:complete len:265 (-) Transcript_32155:91-885(-)